MGQTATGHTYHHELLPNIEVIEESFDIPQHIKTRRIAALLPCDYYRPENMNRRYSVLYLQDGQNLFDDYAPFGNWGVDKQLAYLKALGKGDVIVVAIDHAEENRIKEYTPSYETRLGLGDGKRYVRFLAEHLKPYIDNRYRTLADRTNTGIGGSSMGGLISIYAGFMYPHIYSKLMIFSPSLWVAPNIHFHTIRYHRLEVMRIYLYGGGQEGSNMVPNLERLIRALETQGQQDKIDIKLSIDPHGQHNEWHWGAEFPTALEWLYY